VEEDTKLKKLSLRSKNLSSVDPAVLATAVTRLEDVDLETTCLTTEQITSILDHVEENTKLKKLWLGGNNTSDIDLDVVRNARERLGDGLGLELVTWKDSTMEWD